MIARQLFKQNFNILWMWLASVVLLLVLSSCQNRLARHILTPESQVGSLIETSHPIIIPSDLTDELYGGLRSPQILTKVYGRNGYQPLWFVNNYPTAKADDIARLIISARRYGLLPHQYHALEIATLSNKSDVYSKTRLDILLTDALLVFAGDLHGARTSTKYQITADTLRTLAIIDSAQTFGIMSAVRSMEPSGKGYLDLKSALNNLLDSIPDEERNLVMSGITNDSSEVQRTIRQIEINMERWRKEKTPLGSPHAWVNIPAFMFYVYEDSHTVMSSRVIVGAPVSATPEFSSKIECFTIFPYWYVPRKITVREYLPLIKKDTSFITRNNFDVLDKGGKVVPLSTIEWELYDAKTFPFTLRQREGTENSLGVIKFIFDNPYAVFVHDTNSKRLFQRSVRAYSHGCIRLEKAYEFAQYLIQDGRSRVAPSIIDKCIKEEKRTTITLLKSVPIHIRYFTAEVRNGKLETYPDIYKKDKVLINRLYKLEAL